MIVLTGAGGFIGSVVLGYLNKQGITKVSIFDDLPTGNQFINLNNKNYSCLKSITELPTDPTGIECVIHLGANSDTLEKDWQKLYYTNVLSTRAWSTFCQSHDIPFIFASSAAVYGNGNGPLNHYAFSKSVSELEITGAVFRLFNVYGPNEYHKGRMASTVFHWFNQLEQTGELKIFDNSDLLCRDFIWVEDVARVILHLMHNYRPGVYDLGTGQSTSFETVADQLIRHYGSGSKTHIPMPDDLRNQYQNNTQADVSNLRSIGVDVDNFLTTDQGIAEYLKYLKTGILY